MRIGLITDAFNPAGGGAERWTAQFRVHLLAAGHEVHVITFGAANHDGARDLHLLSDPGTEVGRAEAVAAAVAGLGPMVLHDSGTGWSAHVFHPQAGSRLLAMDQYHTSYAPWLRIRIALSPRMALLRRRMARIEQRAATQARRVVAVSNRLRGLLAERHRLPPQRLAVIPNGVDTVRFAPARLAPLRAAARARLGVGDGLLFLMVAHNLRLKGFDTALRALAAVRAHGGTARLAVAGGMPDPLWLGLVEALGLTGLVIFCGDVAEVEHLYAAADVFLHPTRWDACSLATIEALAASLPVVTTAANGAADLITDGVDGFVLSDPRDHRRLSERMLALRDPAFRDRMGKAARGAAAKADIVTNCRAVEALLTEVAAELQYGKP